MPTPWTTRIWQEYRAGNLTRAYRDLLLTLHTYRGRGGVAWPAHATLAERSRCSARTVRRALNQAQALGLVTWVERRVRAGWRWLRASNLYRLLTPLEPVQARVRAIWPRRVTTGQPGRGGERSSKKEALTRWLREAAALPDLLAMRRAAIERRAI